ncbi:MAG: hypothetical protein ACFFCS_28490 [Candidatus Hodarchaeota archaeon]
MDSKEFWNLVKTTKPRDVIIFYALIGIGIIIYDFTDFLVIRLLSAQTASLWLNIFGMMNSTVRVIEQEVYLYPLGLNDLRVLLVEGCTPAAGIFPLFCLFAIPHSSWKLKVRNFLIYIFGIFFALECLNATEYSRWLDSFFKKKKIRDVMFG